MTDSNDPGVPFSGKKQAGRVGWDEYFINIAEQVAKRSTCSRKHVGAVIVREKMILATGYNGSIRGTDHCDDVGHLIEDGHCIRTVHAETNAIVQAARTGNRIEGACIYVTASPCFNCFKLIANAGIIRIVFKEFYREPRVLQISEELNIEMVEMTANGPRLARSGMFEKDQGLATAMTSKSKEQIP